MSLYLGPIGRGLLKLSTKYNCVDKAADRVGNQLTKITKGRYRVGLSRLAYSISQEIIRGEKINLVDGKILTEDGTTLIEDPLLEVGKDFRVIPVTKTLSKPEGMAEFLRRTYLKPDRWGLRFSDAFGRRQRSYIRRTFQEVHEKITGYPLTSFPIPIKPLTHTNLIILNLSVFAKNLSYSDFPMASLEIALRVALGSSSLFPLVSFMQFILVNTINIGLYISAAVNLSKNKYEALLCGTGYGFTVLLSDLPPAHPDLHEGTAHEHIHLLKQLGYIKNDIIANAIFTSKTTEEIENIDLNPFATFSLLSKIYYPRIEGNGFYTAGKIFEHIALYLGKVTGNKENKWRFLRIVSQHTDKEELLAELQADKEFGPYFKPRIT